MTWGAGNSRLRTNLVVGPHLLLFHMIEVFQLTRSGFLAAYVLRLACYSILDVAWSQLRSSLLFGA